MPSSDPASVLAEEWVVHLFVDPALAADEVIDARRAVDRVLALLVPALDAAAGRGGARAYVVVSPPSAPE